MGYIVSLDEYTEEQLKDELLMRLNLRVKGLCDYCGLSLDTRSCKFPKRHKIQEESEEYESNKGTLTMISHVDKIKKILLKRGYTKEDIENLLNLEPSPIFMKEWQEISDEILSKLKPLKKEKETT